MSNMCRRERVLTAMRCEQPDRVPAVLWGSYYIVRGQCRTTAAEKNLGKADRRATLTPHENRREISRSSLISR
ncbi:MAG: hypothetical protein NTV46_15895 [Verrucomicrobia bacterium]|nr:hypothetical protein [Verrucomicrobiota bacterium]